jgi:hypothetical protein
MGGTQKQLRQVRRERQSSAVPWKLEEVEEETAYYCMTRRNLSYTPHCNE